MSEAIKLARLQRDRAVISGMFDLVQHPIFSVVLSFAFIEYLQSRKMMGENVGTMLEAGIIAAPVLQSLAQSGAITEFVKTTGEYGQTAVKSLFGIAQPLALGAGK